jgi:hypothetical protein
MHRNIGLFWAGLGFYFRSFVLVFLGLFLFLFNAEGQAPLASSHPSPTGMGPLRVHPSNPRYFQNSSGKAVYLSGSTFGWELLGSDNNTGDFVSYLNLIEQNKHNLIRLWSNENTWRVGYFPLTPTQPMPWRRTGPGKALDEQPKFDLNQFDPAFFDALRSRAMEAQRRGIYVIVMFFASVKIVVGNVVLKLIS